MVARRAGVGAEGAGQGGGGARTAMPQGGDEPGAQRVCDGGEDDVGERHTCTVVMHSSFAQDPCLTGSRSITAGQPGDAWSQHRFGAAAAVP